MRKTAAGFLLLLALVADLAFAQDLTQAPVQATKHNLSTSGPGPIKSAAVTSGGTTEICVFCHTPHGASTSVSQLWNRQPSSVVTYTLYGSDYLGTAGAGGGLVYPMPAQPKDKSKLCLSCHDGTIAIGSVYNLPGPGGAGTITMTGVSAVAPVGAMPTTAAGYLGGDKGLTDDHPVGYLYCGSPARPECNNLVLDPELVPRAWPWTTAVKLDPNASTGTVECQSCHDPHNNQWDKFLRMSNANAGLCTFCHIKTGYAGVSSHATSFQPYTPIGGKATTVGEYSCRSCHKPHTALGKPLLNRAEELTCYDAGCHGTNNPNATNTTSNTTNRRMLIQPEMIKDRRHPTNDNISPVVHKNLPFSTTTGAETPTDLGSGNRHAECYDCHNPHQVQKPVAAAPAEKSTRGALRISLALKGVWGVEPNWTSPLPPTTMLTNAVEFATPVSFTPVGVTPAGVSSVPPITDEYQVCMKCHSNYATLPIARNIAAEINPNNSSYHGIVPGGQTNYFVNATTMVQPWGGTAVFVAMAAKATVAAPTPGSTEWNRQNPGSVAPATATAYANRGRVWCSDCHGSELSTMPPAAGVKAAPYGPHGSTPVIGFVPGTSNSNRMLVRTIASTAAGTPLCLGCHLSASYQSGNTGSRNNRHSVRTYTEGCFACHMWDNAGYGAGATGGIFPHGMNKRWVSTITGSVAGSGQMVDSFLGGYYSNINYTTATCWMSGPGNPCGDRGPLVYSP